MDKKLVVTLFAVVIILLGLAYFAKGSTFAKDSKADEISNKVTKLIETDSTTGEMKKEGEHMKEIYLAGGCFWGLEEYFSRINGVIDVVSGYANGKVETTNYKLIHDTDHAETIHVTYDADKISLRELLLYYFRVIEMTQVDNIEQVFIMLMRQIVPLFNKS